MDRRVVAGSERKRSESILVTCTYPKLGDLIMSKLKDISGRLNPWVL